MLPPLITIVLSPTSDTVIGGKVIVPLVLVVCCTVSLDQACDTIKPDTEYCVDGCEFTYND